MRTPQEHLPVDVRALLESTETPFAVVGYGQRAVIFSQGDESDSVMHVQNGRIRLAVTAPNGKEAIIGLVGAGAFLGEEALGGYAVRRQTATAMAATDLLVVAKAQMLRLVRTQPALADRFIVHVLARNSRLEADLSDQLLNSSEQRLARTLLVLAGCVERRPCRCVLPDISQEIIAEMVGTTRSRVNVFMSRFKKLGLIEEDRGVLQVRPPLLHALHDGTWGVPNGTSPVLAQALRSEKRQ